MEDIKVTLASIYSGLTDPWENLNNVKKAAEYASRTGSRILLLPELMLTGHGGHARMIESAENLPDGPLSSQILQMSKEYSLCICAGIAEKKDNSIYNSQMVADKGIFLGVQRKINLSGDECCYFSAGGSLQIFDIGEARFGILICYDNEFPELALIQSLYNIDLILAPHAARCGIWDGEPGRESVIGKLKALQDEWEKLHTARAIDHNVYVLLCNAVGQAAKGIPGVQANHAGTVMGIDPCGDVFLRTGKTDFSDEMVTVELKKEKIKADHAPKRNRQLKAVAHMFNDALKQLT